MQQVEFQYGSENQGFKLTGTAEFKFGNRPRFDGVLSGRQIDLDRALADGGANQSAPAAAVRKLADLAAAAFRPTIPIQIGVGIDRVTLGGNSVDALRGDISTDAGGWNLDRFEFRAPGFTKVRLSGRLAVDDAGVVFTGPAEIEATDPKVFAAWIEGRAAPEQGELRPLRLRGEVTLSGEKLAVERLNAEFERKAVTGRLVYAFAAGNRAAKLEAELTAPELDIDAALGFGKALLSGSNLERPQDMIINADIGRATFAGIEARSASARLKVDGNGLQLDRLSVADFGGGLLSASGRIDTGGHAPRGALVLDFETRQAPAIAALAGRFAPKSASQVTALLDRVGHAKLHATFDVADEKGTAATVAQLAVAGDLDAMHLDAKARMIGDWAKPAAADVHIGAAIDAAEGATLLKLVSLDQVVAAGKGPGHLNLQIDGPADGDMSGSLRLSADGLLVQSIVRGSISLDQGAKLTGSLQVPTANLRALYPASVAGNADRLPLSFASRIAIAGRNITLDDIDASLGGSAIRGHLTIDGASPRRIDGALDADTLDAAALIASATGMPASAAASGNGWAWSSAPFAGGVLGDFAGQVALKAQRANITPQLAVREFRAALRLGKDAIAFDDMAGEIAGGRLGGQLVLRSTDAGLNARGKITLTGADATGLLPAATRPPVTGSVDFSTEIEGAGLSPAAMLGSLRGSANITLSNGQLAGLDPHAFDIVSRAVDNGLAPGTAQLSGVVGKALDSGRFPVKRAQGDIAVSAGQARLSDLSVHGENTDLSLVGNLDLTDGMVDARLVLSGPAQAGGMRPDIYIALTGPLAAPTRAVDVSALTGWLTLRAIENQSRRLKAIEGAAPSAPPGGQVQPPKPKTQQAPALAAPVDIKPLPIPQRATRPEASVDPHH
jgi:hypothetical protein